MLQHANIHKSCLCYQKGDKQIISLKEYCKGENGQSILTSHHMIFILSGAAKYSIPGPSDTTIIVPNGKFIFLPVSTNVVWEVLEDTVMLLFRLSNLVGKLPECNTFRFQRLSGNLETYPIENEGIYPLKMNKHIRHFIKGVVATERDGLKCSNYARHLVAQLLTLTQVYYRQDEYMRFYSTVSTPDVIFSDHVYERWMECRSVGELANALEMPTQQFTLHFIKVFGENPGAWLQKRRREYIYHDICSSYKSLRQIAAEHNFSMSNFIRYCHMNFDTTPGAIRESLSIDIDTMGQNLPDLEQAHLQPIRVG